MVIRQNYAVPPVQKIIEPLPIHKTIVPVVDMVAKSTEAVKFHPEEEKKASNQKRSKSKTTDSQAAPKKKNNKEELFYTKQS